MKAEDFAKDCSIPSKDYSPNAESRDAYLYCGSAIHRLWDQTISDIDSSMSLQGSAMSSQVSNWEAWATLEAEAEYAAVFRRLALL